MGERDIKVQFWGSEKIKSTIEFKQENQILKRYETVRSSKGFVLTSETRRDLVLLVKVVVVVMVVMVVV